MSDMESMPLQAAELHVIPAQFSHLDGIIFCHMAAFPDQFLTLLGKGFLRSLYRFYTKQAGGICLVSIDSRNGHVLGLVAGGAPRLRSVFLRRYLLRFILTAGIRSLTYHRVRERLTEHLLGAFRALAIKCHLVSVKAAVQPEPEMLSGTWSNLLSICVHPSARGRGVGKALMEAFRVESRRRGYRAMRLSVRNDNDFAIALYVKCGWSPILVTPSGTYFKKSVEEST